jgi:hypothetical protein
MKPLLDQVICRVIFGFVYLMIYGLQALTKALSLYFEMVFLQPHRIGLFFFQAHSTLDYATQLLPHNKNGVSLYS